jgi:hypothetical protein
MIIVPVENIKGIISYEQHKREITKNSDYVYGEPIIFKKDNSFGIYDCFVNSKFTNLGFRLAYFLWNLKGSNMLGSLNYYSKHVNDLTDDNMTLRGAYGPRMRFWIGADQLQEAINTNSKIDDPEDFVKPKGVDQLQKCFEDLENGMETSSCVIFDPSLDFEDSKNIPDLISITFKRVCDRLDMIANFGTICLNKDFVNDYFFLSLLHICMCSLMNKNGFIYFCIANPKFSEDKIEFYEYNYKHNDLLPQDFLIGAFWDNIFKLYDFEKHLRCAIYKESVHSEQVDLIGHCDMLLRKFIEPIEDAFWQDFGKTILICSLLKYGDSNYKNYIEDIINTMEENGFKKEILEKIERENK